MCWEASSARLAPVVGQDAVQLLLLAPPLGLLLALALQQRRLLLLQLPRHLRAQRDLI